MGNVRKDFTVFKGKLAKVKFDDYSKNGTPTRAVIVQIDRDISFDLPHPARATPRYPVRIYTQTHRSAFLKGDKLSQVYK